MCGRYYYHQGEEYLTGQFIDEEESENIQSGDMYPSERISVIIYKNKKICLENMTWGYSTSQALIINARSETLLDKPLFKKDAIHHRCLVIANGFYEWDEHKHKISFESTKQKDLLMAGIFRGEHKEVAIITTNANDIMKPIHSRMPLLIPKEDMKEWLVNDERVQEFLESMNDDLKIVSGTIQQSLF